jgi:hypothetical protein
LPLVIIIVFNKESFYHRATKSVIRSDDKQLFKFNN